MAAAGRFGDAAALLQARLADAHTDASDRAGLLAWLADVDAQLGHSDEARRAADEADPLARARHDFASVARLEAARGHIDGIRGLSLDAIAHYRNSLAAAEQAHDAGVLEEALGGMAAWYEAAGDWTRALYYAQRAFDADSAPSDRKHAIFLYRRGIAYEESGARDDAVSSFTDGLQIARRIGDQRLIGLMIAELAGIYHEIDHDDVRAASAYEDALRIFHDNHLTADEVAYANNAANVYRDAGDSAEALRRYRAALALAERAHVGRTTVFLRKNIGQTLADLHQDGPAADMLLAALHEADAASAAKLRWQARLELARLVESSNPAAADRYFSEALDVLEANQAGMLLDNFKAGALGAAIARYDLYDAYIHFLLEHDRGREAFVVAERGRARVFLENLAGAREGLAGAVPDEMRRREADLLRDISAGQIHLRDAGAGSAANPALRAAIDRDEQALAALRLRFAIEYPSLAGLRFPRVSTVDDLQQALAPGQVFVSYFLGVSQSTCFVVSRRTFEVLRLPARAEIDSKVAAAVAALRRPDGNPRPLLAPLWPLLGFDRIRLERGQQLVIVPHGVLAYLPFETMLAPDGAYLITRVPISYEASASTAMFLRTATRAPVSGNVRLAAIGDPVTGSGAARSTRAFDARTVGALAPLAYAGEELRKVVDTIGGPAVVLGRDGATEAALETPAVRGARIVHFATHALVDEQHPERSALALTAKPPASDGILQVRHIYRLRLTADLVTLSACDTALGANIPGEGFVNLARALNAAGARTVVATLWDIDDAASVGNTVAFYRGIRDGEPVADALREAKLRAIDAGAHPYYWAAFIATGNADRPVTLPRSSAAGRLEWLCAVVLLAQAAVFLFA
jgi:tetratricopeptide (TPR) repeat protein